ncbi:AraC family transcriptional regulator [Sphaerisporangium melleum]|uniref:AraC family transcriptional regulator n=1 Tax=Sphaerisporangium melleum TaxID=321316 RepID=A0A917VPI2_9ACTN|nr:AraC family transcriptional regulator [Sphaerisporangium melleum]GGL01652.1 AraC family transcriptional regulator [Sphaerisporangium melleum]GII72147.1 AraC family transcriptional regulator [Sphaerisporangium melleum]
MDVLSDVLAVMHVGRPVSARVRRHAPWGRSYPPSPGAAFHVVLQGTCWLLPSNGAPIALSPGDVVFLPRAIDHALADSPSSPLTEPFCFPGENGLYFGQREEFPSGRAEQGSRPPSVTLCGAYRFDAALAHPLLNDLPEIVHLPARLGRHPELRAAVDLLGAELENSRIGADAAVPALLDVLLLYILRAWFSGRPEQGTTTGWAAALSDPAITAALSGIHRDPSRPWTVEELGRRGGLSRTAFARRFTALVGRPPLTYLTWWRMIIARRLLRDSEAPLSMVARQVGYASEFAFANAFKRQYGIAPGKYRRQDRTTT